MKHEVSCRSQVPAGWAQRYVSTLPRTSAVILCLRTHVAEATKLKQCNGDWLPGALGRLLGLSAPGSQSPLDCSMGA